MPKLKNYRCDIHVIALLFKMAVSLQQEEYVWKIIRNEKSENDSVGMKRMVEASDEINTMLESMNGGDLPNDSQLLSLSIDYLNLQLGLSFTEIPLLRLSLR